jgi:hypothetical protein
VEDRADCCRAGISAAAIVPTEKDPETINLGLDLKGTHLVMQVNVADAVKAEADQAMERVRTRARRSLPTPSEAASCRWGSSPASCSSTPTDIRRAITRR